MTEKEAVGEAPGHFSCRGLEKCGIVDWLRNLRRPGFGPFSDIVLNKTILIGIIENNLS